MNFKLSQKMRETREQKSQGSAEWRWDLIFLDKRMEFLYQKSSKVWQYLFLRLFLAFKLGISGILVVFYFTIKEEESAVFTLKLLNIMNATFLFFCFGAIHKTEKLNRLQPLIIFFQLYSFLAFNGLMNGMQKSWDPTVKCLSGLVLQIIMFMPLISRCHWKLSAISSLLLTSYSNVHLIDINENVRLKGFPALVFIFNLMFIITCSYFKEKLDRNIFKLGRNSDDSLKQFKTIMKNILPCSTLIFRDRKVVFQNQELLRLLQAKSGGNLEEKLRNIKIIEINPEGNLSPSQPTILETDSQFLRLYSGANKKKNLLEILSEDKYEASDCGFEKFQGVILPQSTQNQRDDDYEKLLEIKICKISWDGSEALIVMITEDVASYRIKNLAEQDRYKNKLLATVSHDLRTPLNGMIGILELVLENVTDHWIRKK